MIKQDSPIHEFQFKNGPEYIAEVNEPTKTILYPLIENANYCTPIVVEEPHAMSFMESFFGMLDEVLPHASHLLNFKTVNMCMGLIAQGYRIITRFEDNNHAVLAIIVEQDLKTIAKFFLTGDENAIQIIVETHEPDSGVTHRQEAVYRPNAYHTPPWVLIDKHVKEIDIHNKTPNK